MSWLGMITSGWLFEKQQRVISVSGRKLGVVRGDEQLTGSISEPASVLGVVGADSSLVGTVVSQDNVITSIIQTAEVVVGFVRGIEQENGMTDFSFRRRDSYSLSFVVLDDPATLSGAWTWDGTTTVASDDTSGVAVGDWVRAPASDGCDSYPLFKVSGVSANVSVTIDNGDDLEIPSSVSGAEGATPIDLTDAVVRAAAKKRQTDTNNNAAIFSASYTDPDGIEVTDAVGGEGIWHITTADQEGVAAGSYFWEIETARKGTQRSTTGTATFATGSRIITFSDTVVSSTAKTGDIFHAPSASNGANQIPVTIVATPSTDTSLSAGEVLTDYDGFVTEAGAPFGVFRANRKTPAGLSGKLTLLQDTVG